MKRIFVTIVAVIAISALLAAGCNANPTVSAFPAASSPPTAKVTVTTYVTPPPDTTAKPVTPTPNATTFSPTLPSIAPEVPNEYQALYSQIQGWLNDADKQVQAAWDGSAYPVGYAAELLTADANAGQGILQASTQKVMMQELDAEAAMGVKAITVQIGFPILDQNFYMFQGQTAVQAQQSVQTWLDYYVALAQTIHTRGMKMIVESNPLLTYYLSADSPLNPGNYYKTLDFAAYQAGRSQHNITVATQIKPDYLLLQTEPDTDAVNDYRQELNNGTKDAAMIKQFVTDLESAGIPGLHTTLQIGSGAGAWLSSWKTYINGLAAIPGLDKLDTHIYNIQPSVNQIGEFGVAMQIADMAHGAGKGVSISEFWCHKSAALSGFNEGADSLVDIRVRDMFTFWQPLDAQFLNIMGKLAVGKHFNYISGFGHYDWFTEIEYNALKTVPVYPIASKGQNDALDAQITTTQNLQAKQALAKQEFSPLGDAYRALIRNGPKR